ncbi:MAG: hypothetical protein R3E96_06725 [Planctomycetota bacterium]
MVAHRCAWLQVPAAVFDEHLGAILSIVKVISAGRGAQLGF